MKNWIWFVLALFAGVIVLFWISYGKMPAAQAQACKVLNANCSNASDHSCCAGLSCQTGAGGYKCRTAPTPSPTVTPTPSPTVTPTPTTKPVKDYCKNFEKDQKEIPYGMVSVEGICSCAEGYHQVDEVDGLLELRKPKKEYDTFTCEKDAEPTPEATPTASICRENCGSPPTFAGSSTEPPRCGSTAPEAVVNPHVYRNGDQAIVKWWPVGGNKVHIYYKEVKSPDWQYSVTADNTGYFVINGLDSMDISFAVQAVNDCSGGVSVMSKVIVDGVSDTWVLYR